MKDCNPGSRCRRSILALRILPVLLVAIGGRGECDELRGGTAAVPSSAGAGHVGSAACRSCHEAEYAAWLGSDHDLAMQPATAETVLGDFRNARFEAHGVQSSFFERNGTFFVRTDGPGGALADYGVKFTFGVRPLQQYLVEFPGGRLQALPIAWDSRPKNDGGQHWFHLVPDETLARDDQLHWTGIYQNWNLQCAACHSTDLHKNYDAATNSYATTYSEIDVACESCHGPGAEHAAWAAKAKPPYAADDRKGLPVLLRRRPGQGWRFATPDARYATIDAHDARADSGASTAAASAADRSVAATGMNVCAPCHARRSTIQEVGQPGAPLEDSHRLALLTEPLYFADGQQHDEVYTWGSFVQSKMYARGVTCSDCHDPHTLKTRAAGNVLCSQCHNAAAFDTREHHFHEPGSKGARCIECHMPSRDYMVIDGRRDHGFRVPRPDVSDAVGSPDVCSGCHIGRTARWAADAMDRWYGVAWRTRPESGSTLHKATSEGAKALAPLLALASDRTTPAIVRATAASLAQPVVRPEALAQARTLLADEDALVRLAAVGLLEPFDADVRVSALVPLLSDPRRSVRVEAARVLADVGDDNLPVEARPIRAAARTGFVTSLQADADWPAAVSTLGNLSLREGKVADAVSAFERALQLDPRFVGAYVNLADALRAQGKDVDGERVLRRGLALLPEAASLHHALGLLLVRAGDKDAGVAELGQAAKLDPGSARFAYVHAVGLRSIGRNDDARVTLEAADRRHPYDLDILGMLVSVNLEAGRTQAVLPYARRIAEVLPEDTGIRGMIAQLERTK